MNNNDKTFSLLPYLNAHQGCFYLAFPLFSKDTSILNKSQFPFLVVSESDPVTRMVEAQLTTDAGSELKKTFILVQRDNYLLTKDELWPINNNDIEEAWQKAFRFYTEENRDSSLILLSGQIDESRNLKQLLPLFFCKDQQLYFHPPCPNCGLPLQQCEDDDLLTNSGLQAYSNSLKRYLYCSSCASSTNSDLYTYESVQSDPPSLKDRRALIQEFGQLKEIRNDTVQFPCIDCLNHQECYGPDHLASSRIVPFSFYPFYMFIFDAMSLNAMDYLSLVGGGTFEELEDRLEKKEELGRSECLKSFKQKVANRPTLLSRHNEKSFLEVIYLKLSFLEELCGMVLSNNNFLQHPDLRLSLDRIWIKLSDQGSLLHSFWNFKIEHMDIFRAQGETKTLPGPPANDSLLFAGLVWFYALLVNKQQDVSEVYLSLKETIDQYLSGEDFVFEELIAAGKDPTFLPANIFWNPAESKVNKHWQSFWDQTLQIGWLLLKSSYRLDSDFSQEKFFQQLAGLREEIKTDLFGETSLESRQALSEENEAIYGILKNIQDKWRAEIKGVGKSVETVAPSSGGTQKEATPPREEVPAETVIITPGDKKKAVEPSPELALKEKEEIPAETVIITPGDKKKPAEPSPELGLKEKEEIPEETIIISAQVGKGSPEDTHGEQKKEAEDDDFSLKTVILKPEDIEKKG